MTFAELFQDRARATRWLRLGDFFTWLAASMMIVAKGIWPAWLPRWGIVTMPLWGPVAVLIGGFIVWRLARRAARALLGAIFDD